MRGKKLILLTVCFALIVRVFSASAAKKDYSKNPREPRAPRARHNPIKINKLALYGAVLSKHKIYWGIANLRRKGLNEHTIYCIIADLGHKGFVKRAIYNINKILNDAIVSDAILCNEAIYQTKVDLACVGLLNNTIKCIIADLRFAGVQAEDRRVWVVIQNIFGIKDLSDVDLRDTYRRISKDLSGDEDPSGVYFDYAYPDDIKPSYFDTISHATFNPPHLSDKDRLALKAIRSLKAFYELKTSNPGLASSYPGTDLSDLSSEPEGRFSL